MWIVLVSFFLLLLDLFIFLDRLKTKKVLTILRLGFQSHATRKMRHKVSGHWNDRRSRRVFPCFYSAIFQLTSAKFQTFAYNSRTV